VQIRIFQPFNPQDTRKASVKTLLNWKKKGATLRGLNSLIIAGEKCNLQHQQQWLDYTLFITTQPQRFWWH
jgi:hypothetical protein